MAIFQILTDMLHQVAQVVPTTVFVFIGAFIEELIAPIPSPVVMTLAGSLAKAAEVSLPFLVVLAFLGSVGKTIGSFFIYLIADKTEDLITSKIGKYIGVTHKDVENISKLLDGSPRSGFVLLLLRAIPIIPTAPVSIVAGLIQFNLKVYLLATFVGTFFRNLIYLYFGYTGATTLESLNEGFDSVEKYGYLIIFILLTLLVLWFYKKKKTGGETQVLSALEKKGE